MRNKFVGKELIIKNGCMDFIFYGIGACIKERPSAVSTHTYLVDQGTIGQFVGLRDVHGVPNLRRRCNSVERLEGRVSRTSCYIRDSVSGGK